MTDRINNALDAGDAIPYSTGQRCRYVRSSSIAAIDLFLDESESGSQNYQMSMQKLREMWLFALGSAFRSSDFGRRQGKRL